MSDYEPFEAAQGDPWSTEPVGEPSRQKRDQELRDHREESEVLARMPHVHEEASAEPYRHYGQSGSSRRRRSPSRRPGIPAPVWVVVGMGLVVLVAAPFLFSGKSSEDTAFEGPDVWQAEMPAPDADLAPAWSSSETVNQWGQSGSWNQESTPAEMVNAEPAAPGGWNTTGEWIGAPANMPYANNAADPARQMPVDQQFGGNPSSATVANQWPRTGWDTNQSSPPAAPPEADYQAANTSSPSTYPMMSNGLTPSWPGAAEPTPRPAHSNNPAAAGSWDQTRPSLATPQPENVRPGYGTYPAAQQNPYVDNPTVDETSGYQHGYAGSSSAVRQQYPNPTPNYPIAGQLPAEPYPASPYPQTAMSPQPVSPAYSTAPAAGYGPQPVVPQSVAPSNTYPSYPPPAATNPYVPPTTPSIPGSPPYGAGASTSTSPQSVARLNGTIQEPAARAAYDDRARPSYY